MKYLFLLCLLFFTVSCSIEPGMKDAPSYTEIDPELRPYVTEYKELAASKGIFFNGTVTMGFSKLPGNSALQVLGACYYGSTWREIDVDRKYWDDHAYYSKRALLFHELTHCYCGRDHTYGKDKEIRFPEVSALGLMIEALLPKQKDGSNPMYLGDGCSSSIMRPMVISGRCMLDHYDYYVDEMFRFCHAY